MEEANKLYVNSIFKLVVSNKMAVGIRIDNESSFLKIFGYWDGLKSLPLWYANNNGISNFHDFASFGGWVQPSIKSYRVLNEYTELICF